MARERRSEAIWVDSRSRWQINVQRDGKRKTFTSSTPGRKGKHEAEGKADDWLEAGQPDDIRFERAWDIYLDHIKNTTGKLHYADNLSIGKNWLLPDLGAKRLSKIKLADLQNIINDAVDKGLAKRSCKNIKDKMAGFLVWASDNGYSHSLDCNKIKIPVNAKEAERTVIQPEQLKILFSESTIKRSMLTVTCHYIHAFRLIVCLGLRSGELCGLKVTDYDGTTLTINRSINRVRQITPGKTVNAHRTIVLPQRAKGILAEQEEMLKQQGIRSQWLFPDTEGNCTRSIAASLLTDLDNSSFSVGIMRPHSINKLNRNPVIFVVPIRYPIFLDRCAAVRTVYIRCVHFRIAILAPARFGGPVEQRHISF